MRNAVLGKKIKSFGAIGLAAGIVLGFGAPIGSLFFRFVFLGQAEWGGALKEVESHLFYYAYMVFMTPLVFGLFGYYLGQLDDKITEKKRALEVMTGILETQSVIDDVTGLYNHRRLIEEIGKEVERSQRHGHFLSGLMVDIDGFKKVNDSYGHLTGDIVLREMAFVLNQSIRKVDVIGRYGGDEFVILLPETGPEEARIVSERILHNVRQHRFKGRAGYVPLTVSMGLFCAENAQNLDKTEFIDKIDQAMYRAKNSGKNRIFAYL